MQVIGFAAKSVGWGNGMGWQTEAGPYLLDQRNGMTRAAYRRHGGLVTEAGIRIMRSKDGRTVRGQGGRLLTTETEDPVRGG